MDRSHCLARSLTKSFSRSCTSDPCFQNPEECLEAHPAAVCALPVCDADEDDALLALPQASRCLS
eukprot:SAG31_NODE_30921_length_374_cov_1.290909_2_plen_64_part_01